MSHKGRRRFSGPPSISVGREAFASTSQSSSRIATPSLGATVAGRFRIERRIATGAMGEVWQGVHCELRLRVAIKTLRSDMTSNHEVVARFSREAFLLGRIQSDHVVRVLDFVADRRLGPVLVTEFVDGPSLSAILAARRLTVEEGVDLAIDLASGLRELHRARIVHRDVKPANVLMRALGDDGYRAVFVDLGVSRFVPEGDRSDDCLTEITTADRAVGTVEYMAPEQILSSRNVTAAADLYAVGAILYRAITGQHAFGEMSGVDLMKRKLAGPAPPLVTGRGDPVARGFEELVGRALAASPGDRYEVADEMLADLSLLRDTARRVARAPQVAVPTPAVAEQSAESAESAESRRPWLSAKWMRGVWRPLFTAVCIALASMSVGLAVGVESARHARRSEKPSSPETVQFHGARCTVLPTAAPAREGASAFVILCDGPLAP
jgi:serine/threonine-protein kinase